MMSPNSGAPLQLAIASVTFDNKGLNPIVAWQVERGNAAEMNDATSAAASLGSPNGSVIVVRATYAYASLLDYFITSPITMSQQVFAQPRVANKIPCPPPSSGQTCN